jgi:hypothetical protein
VAFRKPRFQPQTTIVRERIELIDYLKARLASQIVQTGHIRKHVATRVRISLQKPAGLDHLLTADDDRQLSMCLRDLSHSICKPRFEFLNNLIGQR